MKLIRLALRILLAILFIVGSSLALEAKGAATGASKGSPRSGTQKASSKPREKASAKKPKATKAPAVAVARDARGRIQRSDAARHAFARQTG
jgi:hypothetical protein